MSALSVRGVINQGGMATNFIRNKELPPSSQGYGSADSGSSDLNR